MPKKTPKTKKPEKKKLVSSVSSEPSTRPLILTCILVLAVFGLCAYGTPRVIRLFLYGDPVERISLNYSFDGVPVKWGYACFTAFNLEPEKRFGLTVPVWNNEVVKAPVLDHNIDGGPLAIYRTSFAHGIGTHAPTKIGLDLAGKYSLFSCKVGLDKVSTFDYNHGVVFSVWGDGKELYRSPKLRSDADPFPIQCNVTGVKELVLFADSMEVADIASHVDWVDLHFEKTQPPQTSPTAAFTK